MKNIISLRKVIVGLITSSILTWAILKNNNLARLMIAPFLVCSISYTLEGIFELLNKDKLVNIFKKIFKISFFTFYFGFLAFTVYYSLVNKTYGLLVVVFIFVLFIYKESAFNKNNRKNAYKGA